MGINSGCRLWVCALLALLFCLCQLTGADRGEDGREGVDRREVKKVPIVDVTDLYHPYQDAGDNFDLIAAYALPEVDLKAVILDTHAAFRKPVSDHPVLSKYHVDRDGPRDAGFIPVLQLNYIFNRDVPVAAAPFTQMKSAEDKMLDAPPFQQQGIELILKVLRESRDPVHILSFGSARPVAVAYNRDPEVFRRKVKLIHLSAGSSSPKFLEWNVGLDQAAFVRLLRSDLPIAIYPCGTENGAFAYGPHNSYYQLPNLQFIREMDPRLQRYLAYAFGRVARSDFLRAMDQDLPPELTAERYTKLHHVWETAIWMQVSNRRLVRRADGHYRIIPAGEALPDDHVYPNEVRRCQLKVPDTGLFEFELVGGLSNFVIYDRGNPFQNETALREALPEFYKSIRP